jgi:hypothetical protein
MKDKIISLILIGLLIIVCFNAVEAQSNKEDNKNYNPGEIVVGFYTHLENLDPINVVNIDSFQGYPIKDKIEVLNAAVLQVNKGEESNIISNIINSVYVEYAELNYIYKAYYTPNDPKWKSQWGPKRINCEEAWDIQKGDDSFKIAIVDTGIDKNHEDLSGNYVSGGYDWVNDDNNPMDDDGHGAHCAGIAAAVLSNSKGIAGIAQVQVMAEKVLSPSGGTSANVASGITHAADQGADVISLSLGSSNPSSVVEDACNYAYNNKGCVLVAASGNDYLPYIGYPAAYSTVIAVGATNQNDQRCGFSNYGDELELMAPGKDIISSVPSNGYEFHSGTSMATPHVSGVAALVLSEFPEEDNQWIRERLQDTAIDLGESGWDQYYGYGLVDAAAALGGGSPPGPSVTLEIYKLTNDPALGNFDPIEWPSSNAPEWYYRVGIDAAGETQYQRNYNTEPPGGTGGNWFEYRHEFTWEVELGHIFDIDPSDEKIDFSIKLMESDWPLFDDLADISEVSGGGEDDSTPNKPAAMYNGVYDIIDDDLVLGQSDPVSIESGYYVTIGDGINNAKLWFKIIDNYTPEKIPDLETHGSLTWTRAPPGKQVLGSFTIENIGDPQSELDWEITQWPEWGTWSFTPKSGNGLTPEEGEITVDVSVVAPNQPSSGFTGKVKVENKEDPSDFAYIDVTLSTPRTRLTFFSFIQQILEKYPNAFPMFRYLLN